MVVANGFELFLRTSSSFMYFGCTQMADYHATLSLLSAASLSSLKSSSKYCVYVNFAKLQMRLAATSSAGNRRVEMCTAIYSVFTGRDDIPTSNQDQTTPVSSSATSSPDSPSFSLQP